MLWASASLAEESGELSFVGFVGYLGCQELAAGTSLSIYPLYFKFLFYKYVNA